MFENIEEFKDKMGILEEGPIVDLDELEGDDEEIDENGVYIGSKDN